MYLYLTAKNVTPNVILISHLPTLDHLVFSVTQKYFLTLADKLRPYTEQAMKLEPAPWIKDYMVDMDNLYTELILEKLENMPYGQVSRKLENYKVMFASHKPDITYYYPNLSPKVKILAKGDPGIGKTSLVKKIAWDWAKGIFTKVSIVFLCVSQVSET